MSQNRPKISIVNSSSFGMHFPEHIEALEKLGDVSRFHLPLVPTDDDLVAVLADSNAIVAGISPIYSGRVLGKLPKLLCIARHGIGIDNIDIEAAGENGIMVCRTPGAIERNPVAEHALMLILCICRRTVEALDLVRAGEWRRRAEIVGTDLFGKRVGIIGLGNIGSRLSEILSMFQCEVSAYDPYVADSEAKKYGALKVELKALLESSDIISLHCPLTPETRGLLNARAFACMKTEAIIINTARGEVVDEEALLDALRAGKIAGYGTDVVSHAPVAAKDHPLLSFPNVLVVPHLGAYTKATLKAMGDKVVEDLRSILVERKPPEVPVTPTTMRYRFQTV